MIAMYHYTNPSAWNAMNHGCRGYSYKDPRTGEYIDSENAWGLWPSRRLIGEGLESRLVPYEARSPAIFGFPEERPKSWVQYNDSTLLFDVLMKCCAELPNGYRNSKIVLLRVDLQFEDKPLVVEYLHVRKIAKPYERALLLEEKEELMAEGMRDYWNSRVPLDEYDESYILPEVIVFNPIPLERLSFVWEKELYPFLDEVHSTP
jgi:hypothetical protein